MTMEDLATGLHMFNQGIQQYAVNTAIADSTKQIQDLNASTVDETQKRAQQMQIANQLAAKMAGYGATGAQLQAVDRLTPQQFSTPEDYFKASLSASNPDQAKKLSDQASAFQQFQEAPASAKIQEQAKSQSSLERSKEKNQVYITKLEQKGATEREVLKAQSAKDIADTKATSMLDALQQKLENAPQKPLPPKIGESLLTLKTHEDMSQKIIDAVEKRPGFASALTGDRTISIKRFLGDEEAGKLIQDLTTLTAETGKQLYGVRQGGEDVQKNLQQIIPKLNMPAKVFLSEMHNIKQRIMDRRVDAISAWSGQKYNMGGFGPTGSESNQAQSMGITAPVIPNSGSSTAAPNQPQGINLQDFIRSTGKVQRAQ